MKIQGTERHPFTAISIGKKRFKAATSRSQGIRMPSFQADAVLVRVNAGICTAASLYIKIVSDHLAQSALKDLLHGKSVLLNLPA